MTENPMIQANKLKITAKPSARGPNLNADTILDVLTKSGTIFFRWDILHGVTFLTGNAGELLGYSQKEITEDPALARKLIDPEFLPRLDRISAGFYIVSPEAARLEIPFMAKGGGRVQVEARIVPEVGDGGRITGFLGIALNASERLRKPKAAEEARKEQPRLDIK